ncbi:mechanosensitive ion channel [Aeoliella sp. ICT_H6.2]|uniref:Mechanosensitive ion channel n=1 Tax=Aeoliella straminimaris TaxID=2954799 RepID=A0A9X2FC58_9BACT|nr:mechanosensitive ion channel domain-containing protein [Aeoliella straminimaris]MCO6045879.1 mechanosensitive ion channel [Aeoliella straminimaris]
MTRLAQRRLLLQTLLLVLLAGPAHGQQFPTQTAPNPLRSDSAPAQQSTAPQQQPAATNQQPTAPAQAAATDQSTPAESEEASDERDTTPPDREIFTPEQIEERLSRIDSLQLSDAEKGDAKKFYQDALQATTELKKQQDELAKWSTEYTTDNDNDESKPIAGRSKGWYERELAQPLEALKSKMLAPFDIKQAETPALEEKATVYETAANKWSKIVKELEAAPATRKKFLSNYQATRQELEQRLNQVLSDLSEITEITNEVTNARRVALTQRAAKLEKEIKALAEKRKALLLGQEAYDLELELAKRKADIYAKQLAAARNELSERRKQAADEQRRTAEAQADRNKQLIARNPDSLGDLAKFNQGLTEQVQDATTELDKVQHEIDEANSRNTSLTTTYDTFVSRFGDGSLTQASGQLLRDQRAKLPREAQLRRDATQRTSQKNDVAYRQYLASQQLSELEDANRVAEKMLANVRPEDRAEAEPVIREMLASQVDYLKNYNANLDKLEEKLQELVTAKETLRRNTENLRDFIAQRDLWIRSCRPLWASQIQLGQPQSISNWKPLYLSHGIDAMFWSLSPANWRQALVDLRNAAYREALMVGMLIAAFLLLIYFQRKARKQIKELGVEAAKRSCTEFWPSLRTLWLTLVVSLPWPLVVWGIGWMLRGAVIESEFTIALSQSSRTAAWILLLAEFFRQSCRSDGLAEAHLGWPRSALLQLRRYLRWVPVLIVPLVFWFVGLDAQGTEPLWSESLGRVLFLIVMAYTTFALWRLLLTNNSAIYQALDRGTENWLLNMHRIWRPALVLLPVALAIVAAMGYYYTAEQLAERSLQTAAMLLVLMIAGGLLRRWVLLNRRQLAREQARQRRAHAQAAAAAEGEDLTAAIEVPEDTVDLTALSEATRKLLRVLLFVAGVVGAVFIWQDVFPALAWLDAIPLPGTGDHDTPTTWGHLMRALLTLLITYVAVRDIPSVLELAVLQHLPIDQGARYAISTLVRYAILTIGIVIAGALMEIGASLGWLIAAMGVGLGFGLQEIFANFVSGIILLFERPIRVGDIITLGDKTGIVNRIRMRATTIVDWDRKEYVVPNKDLVTERLLNWTLSDQTNRVVINVGIAYGSDTERAIELLHEIIGGHDDVLKDPGPVITFEGFGDSTLDLVVRCYLPNLERRIFIISELHTAINKRFNAEGIEIAFPQRDLHIRSMPPEWATPPAVAADKSNSNGHPEVPTKADAPQ